MLQFNHFPASLQLSQAGGSSEGTKQSDWQLSVSISQDADLFL